MKLQTVESIELEPDMMYLFSIHEYETTYISKATYRPDITREHGDDIELYMIGNGITRITYNKSADKVLMYVELEEEKAVLDCAIKVL